MIEKGAAMKYIVKGDVNQDGKITIDDIASVKLHILDIGKALSGDEFTAGDVTGDNAINTADLGALNMHNMGVKMITEVVEKDE